MYVSFKASESVQISVGSDGREVASIKHYLRQPNRLVKAISEPQLVKQLSDELYELKMRPINFMELYHFQPIVLLKVWSGKNGSVYLKSEGCRIEGINYINKRFNLQLKGILYPTEVKGRTILEGQSDLDVEVELPTALIFSPKAFLERAGNTLLKSVLGRMKSKLTTQLLQDYRVWASQENASSSKSGSRLSPDLGY